MKTSPGVTAMKSQHSTDQPKSKPLMSVGHHAQPKSEPKPTPLMSIGHYAQLKPNYKPKTLISPFVQTAIADSTAIMPASQSTVSGLKRKLDNDDGRDRIGQKFDRQKYKLDRRTDPSPSVWQLKKQRWKVNIDEKFKLDKRLTDNHMHGGKSTAV